MGREEGEGKGRGKGKKRKKGGNEGKGEGDREGEEREGGRLRHAWLLGGWTPLLIRALYVSLSNGRLSLFM